MLNVPKKVNDALHVSLLDGCDLSLDKLGDVIMHDTFQVIKIHFTESNHGPVDVIQLIVVSSSSSFPFALLFSRYEQVWDPKPLIRKGRDRHLFLFELHLIFAKEVKDSQASD